MPDVAFVFWFSVAILQITIYSFVQIIVRQSKKMRSSIVVRVKKAALAIIVVNMILSFILFGKKDK